MSLFDYDSNSNQFILYIPYFIFKNKKLLNEKSVLLYFWVYYHVWYLLFIRLYAEVYFLYLFLPSFQREVYATPPGVAIPFNSFVPFALSFSSMSRFIWLVSRSKLFNFSSKSRTLSRQFFSISFN